VEALIESRVTRPRQRIAVTVLGAVAGRRQSQNAGGGRALGAPAGSRTLRGREQASRRGAAPQTLSAMARTAFVMQVIASRTSTDRHRPAVSATPGAPSAHTVGGGTLAALRKIRAPDVSNPCSKGLSDKYGHWARRLARWHAGVLSESRATERRPTSTRNLIREPIDTGGPIPSRAPHHRRSGAATSRRAPGGGGRSGQYSTSVDTTG
jgi:hypothetical protein